MRTYTRGRVLALVAVLATGFTACATLSGSTSDSSERRIERGLQAAERGDYRQGYEELVSVARAEPGSEAGRKALLALAAIELDPRNPGRRLWAAADLTERYLEVAGQEPWAVRLAETLHLLALELGAAEEAAEIAEERAQRAERDADAARAEAREAQLAAARQPPRFEGRTVPTRVAEARGDRDRLVRRIAELERVVVTQRDELARIRQTLRP